LGKNDISGGKDLERTDGVEQRHALISENSHLPRFGIARKDRIVWLWFHGGATMSDRNVLGQRRQTFERFAVVNE